MSTIDSFLSIVTSTNLCLSSYKQNYSLPQAFQARSLLSISISVSLQGNPQQCTPFRHKPYTIFLLFFSRCIYGLDRFCYLLCLCSILCKFSFHLQPFFLSFQLCVCVWCVWPGMCMCVCCCVCLCSGLARICLLWMLRLVSACAIVPFKLYITHTQRWRFIFMH